MAGVPRQPGCRCDTMSHSQAGCERLTFYPGLTCQWQLRFPFTVKAVSCGGMSTPPSISLIDIPPLLFPPAVFSAVSARNFRQVVPLCSLLPGKLVWWSWVITEIL